MYVQGLDPKRRLKIPYCTYKPSRELWFVSNTTTLSLSDYKANPFEDNKYNCTAMILTNLAEPQWVSVNCTDPLSKIVYCLIEKNQSCTREKEYVHKHFIANNNVCDRSSVSTGDVCYTFVWTTPSSAMKMSKCNDVFEVEVKKLQVLFDAVSETFPPIFSRNNTHTFKYRKCSRKYGREHKAIVTKSACAFHIFSGSKTNLSVENTFMCSAGSYISLKFVCDGNKDCPGRALDEEGCECSFTTKYSRTCKFLVDVSGKKTCSTFYVGTHSKGCQLYGTSSDQPNRSKANEKFVSVSTLNCESRQREFQQDSSHCKRNGQLPCGYSCVKCYSISQICTFKLDTLGHLIPCQTGEHIQNCTAFTCNMMFKCPGYYCIPWTYVCDKKWDCPSGFEEIHKFGCSEHDICTNLFKCRNHHQCIHLRGLCDGHTDCPAGDDEQFCSLQKFQCPPGCECLLFTLMCFSLTLKFTAETPFHIVSIQAVSFQRKISGDMFREAVVLTIKETNLDELHVLVSEMSTLIKLDVSANSIPVVRAGCFQSSCKLKFVSLALNKISFLDQNVFLNLSSLLVLNLTGNPISAISNGVFSELSEIVVFSFLNINMTHITSNLFDGIEMQHFQTDNYHLCCISPSQAECTTELPWYLSCSNLLANLGIQITFYIVSVVVLLLNIVSIILQRVSFVKGLEKTGAYGTTTASINIGDIVCAVPLFILWAADLYFKAPFMIKEEQWRSGVMCHLSFGFSIYFNLLSPLLLCFLSFSRLMVVVRPVDTNFKETVYVVKYIISIFFTCLILACGLTILTWVLLTSIPFILCSPFVDPTDSAIVIDVLTWVVVIFQISAAIFIIVVYIILVRSLKKSQNTIQQAVSKKQSNIALIVQVIIITSSNILCWVPSGMIFLTSLFLDEYPVTMVIWITIAVAPSNSVVNPVVFAVTSLRKILKNQNK